MQFDFSEFHPLDHHALHPVCARYPGGFRRHIEYWAKYQFDWLSPWHSIQCARAKHDYVPFWRGGPGVPPPAIDPATGAVASPPTGELCRYCWEERTNDA